MRVSLIVCTRNREAALPGCLESISLCWENVRELEFETILVDNGSSDNTPAVLRAWAARQTFPVKVVREDQKGLARARNAGLREATGDVIAFTDDDCRLAREYWQDLYRHYSADTVPIVRGGRVELGDPQDLPLTIKIDPDQADWSFPTHPAGFIHGANFTMSRSAFDLIGFFDSRFGAGTPFPGEDCDYIIRAAINGVRIQYVPDMCVYHFHGRRTQDEANALMNSYMRANGALYIKHLRAFPSIIKFMWWDVLYWFGELGGKKRGVLAELGISHGSIVAGNVQGAASYISRNVGFMFENSGKKIT